MVLMFISLALSTGIVVFTLLMSRRVHGAMSRTTLVVDQFGEGLRQAQDPSSFSQALTQWHDDERVTVVYTPISEIVTHEPVNMRSRSGWVIDLEAVCSGMRMFEYHSVHHLDRMMPGFLTGLGILFTFSGLTLGIFGLDPTNAEQLTQGVQRLLGGMSVAFLTSIAGIGMALFWTWQSRAMLMRFHQMGQKLYLILDAKAFIWQPDVLQLGFAHHLDVQSQALDAFETSVYRGVHKALAQSGFGELSGFIRRSIGDGVPDRDLSLLLVDIRDVLQEVQRAQMSTSDAQDRFGDLVEQMLQRSPDRQQAQLVASQSKMNDEAQQVLAHLGSIQSVQGDVLLALNQSAEELKTLLEAARASNAGIIKNYQVIQKNMRQLEAHWEGYRDQLQSLQSSLDKAIEGFEGRLAGSLQQAHGEVDRLLADSLDRFSVCLNELRTTMHALTAMVEGGKGTRKGWLGS